MKTILLTAMTVLSFHLSSGAAPADCSLADFRRLAGETDDAPRFRRAVDAAPNGVLAVPKGDYLFATPVTVTNRCSLQMHPAARLVAAAKMDFVLTWDGFGNYHATTVFDGDGNVCDNLGLFIRGGEIDGRGLASCLRLRNAHHFTLADITCRNGLGTGLEISRQNGSHLYELVANNVYCKCNMSGLSGNVGVDCQVCDCHLTDVIVVDYTVGIRDRGGANRFTRCHVWGGTVPPRGMGLRDWSDCYLANKRRRWGEGKWTAGDEAKLLARGVPEMLEKSVAFEILGGSSVYDGCYADTAEIGYLVSASAVIVHGGFFNNPLMGLRKSTAIVHRKGELKVGFCEFRGLSGCERLYEGAGTNVEWIANSARGGAGMELEAGKLSRPRPDRSSGR